MPDLDQPTAAIAPVVMTAEAVRVLVLPSGKVDRANAAKALGRTPKTLSEWKRLGIGPRSQTIGGREFYDWDEVLAFGRGELPAVGPAQ